MKKHANLLVNSLFLFQTIDDARRRDNFIWRYKKAVFSLLSLPSVPWWRWRVSFGVRFIIAYCLYKIQVNLLQKWNIIGLVWFHNAYRKLLRAFSKRNLLLSFSHSSLLHFSECSRLFALMLCQRERSIHLPSPFTRKVYIVCRHNKDCWSDVSWN